MFQVKKGNFPNTHLSSVLNYFFLYYWDLNFVLVGEWMLAIISLTKFFLVGKLVVHISYLIDCHVENRTKHSINAALWTI